jgi:CrcB protein
MEPLKQCLAIGVAGAVGALARFFVAAACKTLFETSFPVGTLLINLSGSFILGLFLGIHHHRYPVSETTRLAIAVGFVGAYTTFSTFMYETDALLETGQVYKAVANLVISLAIGLLLVRLGAICARHI